MVGSQFPRSLRSIYVVIIIVVLLMIAYLLSESNYLKCIPWHRETKSTICAGCACNCSGSKVYADVSKSTSIIEELKNELEQKNQIIKNLRALLDVKRETKKNSFNKHQSRKRAYGKAYVNPVYLKRVKQSQKATLKKYPPFPVWSFNTEFLYESLQFKSQPKVRIHSNSTKAMVQILKFHSKEVCSYLEENKLIHKCDIAYGGISLDFIQGLNLLFIIKSRKETFLKVIVQNKFEPLTKIMKSDIVFHKEEINIITIISDVIPISRIRNFLSSLQDISNSHITLIIIIYPEEKEKRFFSKLIKNATKNYKKIKVKISYQDGKFERALSRHYGVSQIAKKDALILFVDIDITFTSEFLERCKAYTEKRKSLYFPIVFSLYNPSFLIKKKSQKKPVCSKHFGTWRGAGYGNLCVYKSDYFNIGGFNINMRGWGSEDGDLYHRFVTNSSLRVVRIPDPGIFHHWHPKQCKNEFVSKDHYQTCLGTNIHYDASPEQLAAKLSSCMNKNTTASGTTS